MTSFSLSLDTSITLVFALTLLLSCYYFLLLRPKNALTGRKTPPLAHGAWPIIGHLHIIGGRFEKHSTLHATLGEMADKYGPVFALCLGMRRAVVISSWEMAKESFTSNDVVVSSRPEFIAGKHLGYNYAMFGFAPYGPYWREVRKISILELLSNHRLELLSHIRASEIDASIKELYKVWANRKDGSSKGGVLVEMKQWLWNMGLNIICRMVAGKRYYGSSEGSDEAKRCQEAITDLFFLIGTFVVGDSIPFLRWLDIGGYEKRMKKVGKELDSIVQGWLDEHRDRRKKGDATGVEQDFLDVLLKVLDDTSLGGYEPETIIKATTLMMIAGGSDSTTVTLTWALSLLLNNPEALRKAQEELDVHVGKEKQVVELDIPKLTYLQAIVKETFRLYPAGPLSGPRQFIEDCTLGSYHITKGTRLIINTYKIQRDPRIWPDPLEFKPERFLTTHKGVDVRGQHFELIPFGGGRRACPGTSFALQVVHLALAGFLHAFDFTIPCKNENVDMSESNGLTNMKATPLHVIVAPRLPSSVYT